jgi:RNA polymerase sigma-70 factor (ECF subfamily)
METDLMPTTGEHAGDAESDLKVRRPFAEAVRANQSMVFSIAYHFLRDWTAAEEIAQDVFLQLYRKYGELESDSHVTFWLRKVASHRCVDYVRSGARHAAVSLEDAPEPSAVAEHGDPLLNRKMRQLVASLPEKPRMVMVLRYQEDLLPEEIAKVLDMPVRTVKSHLQRSLAMLREKVQRSMGSVR